MAEVSCFLGRILIFSITELGLFSAKSEKVWLLFNQVLGDF